MKRKLQVFVSSTYTDLKSERQAAVEAILQAGHIPAGMELFAAGDKSQLEIIKRWIEDSDVFMLVLGGRYGSIEPKSKKSYIEIEYEYATSLDKPLFAVVATETYLDEKAKETGFREVIEQKNVAKLQKFKRQVMSKICREVGDTKDIKIAVFESLNAILHERQLAGWTAASEAIDPKPLLEENNVLKAEVSKLRADLERLKKKPPVFGSLSFEELWQCLEAETIAFPKDEKHFGKLSGEEYPLLALFRVYANTFALGVDNAVGMSRDEKFAFFKLAPQLAVFDLVQIIKLQNRIQRAQLSESGRRFLALAKTRDSQSSDFPAKDQIPIERPTPKKKKRTVRSRPLPL